jgi:hypothetical protein
MNELEIMNWINEIDEVTHAVKAEFGNLLPEQLNKKPSAETWSIAQNIDHLIVINESYYPIFKQLHEGTFQLPFMGNLEFYVKWMGNLILNAMEPNRNKKMKTQSIWEPSTSAIDANIVQKFVAHQEQLKKHIQSCSEFIDGGVVIYSPASKAIVYTLEQAFNIIVAHEKRHLNQTREVFENL